MSQALDREQKREIDELAAEAEAEPEENEEVQRPAAPPEDESESGRSYRVLRSQDGVNWQIVGETKAASPKAAMSAVAESTGKPQGGLYAAVPLRNWTELQGEMEVPPPRLVFK